MLIAGGLMIGLLAYVFISCSSTLDADSFREVYKPGEAADQDLYKKQCAAEMNSKLEFPLGAVEKVIVDKGCFSFRHRVANKNIPRIVAILNDTSSYIWGEVGTFMLGKQVVFYDKEDKALGMTNIDIGGVCTYSYPYLRRMKWGALTDNASQELERLISE